MTETTAGNGRRVPGGAVWLFAPGLDAPAELRDTLVDWARANNLDPARVVGSDGVEVDLVDQVIRYNERVDPGTPGAMPPDLNSVWKRRRVTPLLVEPPAELLRPPVGYALVASVPLPPPTPPAAYDWARYERTCDPGRQLDGLGDLCLFLGGTWAETPRGASFIGVLLMLIEKGQNDPGRFHALAFAFPREVTAWLVWRQTSPTPTAAELCAALVENDNKRRALRTLAEATTPAAYVLDNADIWGPEADPTGGPR